MKTLFVLLSLFSTVLFFACSSSTNKRITPPEPPVPIDTPFGLVEKDVEYGTATDWTGTEISLKMDVYLPTDLDTSKRYPLIVYMHGGGYNDGDKSTSEKKCRILADSGFVTATINYRLGWSSGSEADPCDGDTTSFNKASYRAVQDANAAIRQLLSKSDRYRIDTNWIFISGSSAGATIALGAAYMDDAFARRRYPNELSTLGSLFTSGNRIRTTYSIKGVCAIAGALVDSNLISSDRNYPTITFQGQEDMVIPIDQGTFMNCPGYLTFYGSLCQYRQLTRFGQSAVASFLPDAGHGDNGEAGFTDEFMMGSTACFFHRVIRGNWPTSAIYLGTQYNCD